MDTSALPSLADWMDAGLYDPVAGYYAAGRVRFGHGGDFWTFPTRLSPSFGALLVGHLAAWRQALVRGGALEPSAPFVVIELGAGDGTLLRDVLDQAAAQAGLGPVYADLAATLCWRVGERAAALRHRQAEAAGAHGRATLPGSPEVPRFAHLPQGSDDLVPTVAPFAGVILHNELLDVWPHHLLRPRHHELLRLRARPSGATQGPWPLAALRPAMRQAMDAGAHAPPIAVALAWDSCTSPAGADLDAGYLHAIAPWASYAAAAVAGSEPTMLHAPGIPALVRWAAQTLRAGWMLTIDYGAGIDHQLDPAPALPQLRLFPRPAREPRHAPAAAALADLDWPGRQDVTVDIDFSHLAWAGARHGLTPLWHGPQGDLGPLGALGQAAATLAGVPVADVEAATWRRAAEERLRRRGGVGAVEAAGLIFEAARGFGRGSAGFRLLLQEVAGTPGALAAAIDDVGPARLPRMARAGWPVLPGELPALALGVSPQRVAAALAAWEVGPELLARLRPGASALAVVDEVGLRGEVVDVLGALAEAELLVWLG